MSNGYKNSKSDQQIGIDFYILYCKKISVSFFRASQFWACGDNRQRMRWSHYIFKTLCTTILYCKKNSVSFFRASPLWACGNKRENERSHYIFKTLYTTIFFCNTYRCPELSALVKSGWFASNAKFYTFSAIGRKELYFFCYWSASENVGGRKNRNI